MILHKMLIITNFDDKQIQQEFILKCLKCPSMLVHKKIANFEAIHGESMQILLF